MHPMIYCLLKSKISNYYCELQYMLSNISSVFKKFLLILLYSKYNPKSSEISFQLEPIFNGYNQQLKNQYMPRPHDAQHLLASKINLKQQVKMEEISHDSESSQGGDGKDTNQGKWTEDENFKFTIFVNYYQDIFASKHKRKVCKIFKTFSEFLEDRTPAQCRSHYQKIMIKFKTIAKLKRHYKSMYGQNIYKKQFEIFKQKWQAAHQPMSIIHPEIKQFKEFAIQTDQIPKQSCQKCAKCPKSSDKAYQNQNLSSFQLIQPEIDQNYMNHSYFYWLPFPLNQFQLQI